MADPNLYPPGNELGGAQPVEESSPIFTAADLSGPLATIPSSSSSSQQSTIPQITVVPQQVVSATAYRKLATLPIPLNVALQDQLALPAPGSNVARAFLSIRNSAASLGNLLIAFDLPATDLTAGLSLPPGGMLFLDSFVPQNDLHLSCTVALTTAVVMYSNVPVPGLST